LWHQLQRSAAESQFADNPCRQLLAEQFCSASLRLPANQSAFISTGSQTTQSIKMQTVYEILLKVLCLRKRALPKFDDNSANEKDLSFHLGNNYIISRQETAKDLGIFTDSGLKFSSHFPPLLSTPAFSTPEFSTLAFLTVSHFPLLHFQSPQTTDDSRLEHCSIALSTSS